MAGALAAVLLVAAIAAASVIEVAYYAVGPGPVENIEGVLAIGDEPTFDADGDLYFLTVLLDEVTVLEYVDAVFDPKVDLRPRETIRPAGVTPDELREANRLSMEESKQQAVYVALTNLGYDAELTGDGALVVGLVEDSPAVGVLEANDVIVELNGEAIELAGDAVAAVGRLAPGDMVDLVLLRGDVDDGQEPQRLEVTLTLAENPDDPDRGFVGIYLDTLHGNAVFPIDVQIDSRNIGGPSAGLMYALGIMNALTEEDLTKGYTIAGTGTIDNDGHVGAIGGVRQKVFAAIELGAEYVLVPQANGDEARAAAGDDIEVVPVGHIDEALAFLAELEPAASLAASEGIGR